jgi:uncharacterized protein (TIGR02231 family)
MYKLKFQAMKSTIAACILLFITGMVRANDEKNVNSTISRVTVYTQGAQIFRTANYSVSKGVTQITIDGVSPMIDANSLQVKASGAIILLDSKYSLFYPRPEEVQLEGLPLQVRKDIRLLEDSLRNVRYDIESIQNEIDVLEAAKHILQNNGAVRGQGKVNDSIPLLKETMEYYTQKMLELNKKLQVLHRDHFRKTTVANGMEERLTNLKNWQDNANLHGKEKGPIHRITITVKADAVASGKLDISYLVSGAGWTPMYDLRSEIASGKVNLHYKAMVYQNTGIDWNDVPLTISTNNPYHNKIKPELHPWYVDYNQYYQQGGGRGDALKNVPGYAPKESGAFAYEDGNAMTANEFVQVVDHLISAEFRIDLPYTIASNNEAHMVLVKNVDLNADYRYYAVPKYDAAAYLVAEITKLDELQLVPAKANIFFDGSYMGETYLDPSSMDDTLHLSLGKDPNIVVKRTLLKHECKDKVIGTKMERTYAYMIEVKSLKSTAIELIIQDQLPITQNAEIEITANELSKGEHDPVTGLIDWKIELKPGASKQIKFTYTVKHDKDRHLPI